jgi:uncharacterized pyridoxamine 5'-phosphate oxidase family protein
MQEVLDFLKDAGTYYIATVDGDQPHVRPFGTSNIFDGKLYIMTGRTMLVGKQILANPKVEICAMDKKGRWIRISAEATEDARPEAKKAMFDANPQLRNNYNDKDPNTLMLYLKNASTSIEAFGAERKIIKF